jgi:adenylate kinase
MRIAVLGISGVGKSTFVQKMAQEVPLFHLQASELIKARIAKNASRPSSEQLRQGPVMDNQRFMIEEFLERVSTTSELVVFDAHTIIDAPSGLVEVPVAVFRELGLDKLVFLYDDPELIAERRAKDAARVRPLRDGAELNSHQALAHSRAEIIGVELGVPLIAIRSGEYEAIASIIGDG